MVEVIGDPPPAIAGLVGLLLSLMCGLTARRLWLHGPPMYGAPAVFKRMAASMSPSHWRAQAVVWAAGGVVVGVSSLVTLVQALW